MAMVETSPWHHQRGECQSRGEIKEKLSETRFLSDLDLVLDHSTGAGLVTSRPWKARRQLAKQKCEKDVAEKFSYRSMILQG